MHKYAIDEMTPHLFFLTVQRRPIACLSHLVSTHILQGELDEFMPFQMRRVDGDFSGSLGIPLGALLGAEGCLRITSVSPRVRCAGNFVSWFDPSGPVSPCL